MDGYTVRVLSIKQVPIVDKNTQKFTNATRVSIMVGDHGAFTQDFPPGQDSPEIINAWKQKKANEVIAIANS